MTSRIGCWLAAVASSLAVARAAPARADVDTDFANQLHGYRIHGGRYTTRGWPRSPADASGQVLPMLLLVFAAGSRITR